MHLRDQKIREKDDDVLIDCAWCGEQISLRSVYIGCNHIFLTNLVVTDELIFPLVKADLASYTFSLIKKKIILILTPMITDSYQEGYRAVALTCSPKCNFELKRALLAERIRLN